jgi:hypothetical protein
MSDVRGGDKRKYLIGRNIHPTVMSTTREARDLEERGNRLADLALRFCVMRNTARRIGDEEAAAELDTQANVTLRDSDLLFERWRKAAGIQP